MKILFFIFVIFLLKIVEGNERNRRALPPFYLIVEGFKKCLERFLNFENFFPCFQLLRGNFLIAKIFLNFL